MLESNGLGQNQLAAASVSPGWNDPPPINSTIKVSNASSTSETTRTMTNGGVATPSAGRLHLQRQRRPVDPSVQTSENFVQLRGNTSSSTNLQPAKQQQQQQHFHHSRSFPQLSAAGGDAAAVNGLSPPPPPSLATTMAPQPLPPASHGRISVHPASAFTPIGALAPATAVPPPPLSITTKQQNVMPSSAIAVANAQMSPPNQFPALVPPINFVPPHPGGSTASADNEQSPPPALALPPVPIIPMPIQQQLPMAQVHSSAELNSFSSGHSQHSLAANLPFQQIQPVDMVNHHHQQQLQHLPTFGTLSTTNSSMVSNGHHSSPAPPPMLFTPPNFVPIATDHHQYNSSNGTITNSTTNCFNGYQQPPMMAVPSYGGTGIDLNNYKVPVKAAGDVSLNGLQLAAFLTKATLLLQPGPTREGIQLRFNQFGEHVQAGQISEACLKKLNFVVDAIDRHVYDEAWQFFEQMVAAFHGDCTIGGWAHGVRLLLQELRKPPALALPTAAVPTTRSHSAGMRLIH